MDQAHSFLNLHKKLFTSVLINKHTHIETDVRKTQVIISFTKASLSVWWKIKKIIHNNLMHQTLRYYLHNYKSVLNFRALSDKAVWGYMRLDSFVHSSESNLIYPHTKNASVEVLWFLVDFHSSHLDSDQRPLNHTEQSLIIISVALPLWNRCVSFVCELFISRCEPDNSCHHSHSDSWTHSSWETCTSLTKCHRMFGDHTLFLMMSCVFSLTCHQQPQTRDRHIHTSLEKNNI